MFSSDVSSDMALDITFEVAVFALESGLTQVMPSNVIISGVAVAVATNIDTTQLTPLFTSLKGTITVVK